MPLETGPLGGLCCDSDQQNTRISQPNAPRSHGSSGYARAICTRDVSTAPKVDRAVRGADLKVTKPKKCKLPKNKQLFFPRLPIRL